ncbi:DUF58 domain-containing protein [Spirochaeta cellobiosiphila]|uniref:DUF58 domain-containing protein n=1 Tax=Spirochaeta cellobiosiphila TaxID=504483 RepID=UPI0003FC92FB|nr:DUF58 domain-containing protein [Spirochaeta cellobiosiphila]
MEIDSQSILQRVKNLELTSRKLVDSLFAGNYRSVFKGPGLEFNEVRGYVPGDDVRFLDWNVSSRMGSPYTKTYREEREMVLNLVLDLSASLNSGSGKQSRRDVSALIFSLLSYSAVANNDRVGAIFFSDKVESWVPPLKGKKHISRLIQECLSMSSSGKGTDLALALRTSIETMKRRGIVVIISDFKTTGYWRELTLLARKHDVIAIRITDPIEEDFPPVGAVSLVDPESGHSLFSWGRNRKFCKEYHDYWALNTINWQRECRKRRVDTMILSTADDPAQKLIQFFEHRRSK